MFIVTSGCRQATEDIKAISNEYVSVWTSFYPSLALSAGQTNAAFFLEDFSPHAVDDWLNVNQQTLERINDLPQAKSLDERIDSRLLQGQIRRELFRWGEFKVQQKDPMMYSDLINHSLTPVLVRKNLSTDQKVDSVMKRLQGLQKLCATAQSNLTDGRPGSTEAAIRDIRSTSNFIEKKLVSALEVPLDGEHQELLIESCARTADKLSELALWMENELKPRISLHNSYGQEHYARELALAFGSGMTPQRLEESAYAEIQRVREQMDALSINYWKQTRSQPVPVDFEQRIQPVLTDMEQARAQNQQEFLQEFIDLIDRSEQFLREKNLVDLPQTRTLFTALSPAHFAGAAVGSVYSAGPFDPEAETLFYLPTVPDSASEDAKDNFYRSFNNYFNSMIITHEIYPGHYLQLKAAAYHPSRIRPLFVGDDFTEGWASFCEQMMLDEGWDAEKPLTRLAHMRKRLENAVRAYVSVQVHCRGWSQEELQIFAVETGLLPPQFAENLWRRALLSPVQLPSYFIGFQQFVEVYENEQLRLGESFAVRDFNNRVLASGGIPLETINEYLSSQP